MNSLEKQPVYIPIIRHFVFCKYRILNEDGVTEHFANRIEAFVLTTEQLNQLISDVIQDTLNTTAENVTLEDINEDCMIEDEDDHFPEIMVVDKKSITNQFEEIYNRLKV